jgi:hypothetical protein
VERGTAYGLVDRTLGQDDVDPTALRPCRNAGCPGRIPHDLRRTAVRNLERAGIPRSVAMKLTGRKTESVYRRYAIADERDLRVAVERLDAVAIK